jgi:hypothetical protein
MTTRAEPLSDRAAQMAQALFDLDFQFRHEPNRVKIVMKEIRRRFPDRITDAEWERAITIRRELLNADRAFANSNVTLPKWLCRKPKEVVSVLESQKPRKPKKPKKRYSMKPDAIRQRRRRERLEAERKGANQ